MILTKSLQYSVSLKYLVLNPSANVASNVAQVLEDELSCLSFPSPAFTANHYTLVNGFIINLIVAPYQAVISLFSDRINVGWWKLTGPGLWGTVVLPYLRRSVNAQRLVRVHAYQDRASIRLQQN